MPKGRFHAVMWPSFASRWNSGHNPDLSNKKMQSNQLQSKVFQDQEDKSQGHVESR
jgi:hypothetical protein